MTFFSICCPRMLKITCFLASLKWDSLWFNQIHNEALPAFRRKHLELQGWLGAGPWRGGGASCLSIHHTWNWEVLQGRQWSGLLVLPSSVLWLVPCERHNPIPCSPRSKASKIVGRTFTPQHRLLSPGRNKYRERPGLKPDFTWLFLICMTLEDDNSR
jgi:hypothetical protein